MTARHRKPVMVGIGLLGLVQGLGPASTPAATTGQCCGPRPASRSSPCSPGRAHLRRRPSDRVINEYLAEVAPVFRRVGYLAPSGCGWMVAGSGWVRCPA
jgi:hypothetical protein